MHLAVMLFFFVSLVITTVVTSLYLFDKLPSKYKPGSKETKSIAYTMFSLSLMAFVAVATRDLTNPIWLFAFLVSLMLFITMSVILRIVVTGAELPSLASLPIGTMTVYLLGLIAIITVIVGLYTSFFSNQYKK